MDGDGKREGGRERRGTRNGGVGGEEGGRGGVDEDIHDRRMTKVTQKRRQTGESFSKFKTPALPGMSGSSHRSDVLFTDLTPVFWK